MEQEIARMFFEEVHSTTIEEYTKRLDDMDDYEYMVFNDKLERSRDFSGKVCKLFLDRVTSIILPDPV